jgi:glycosyltransferase involved in cell wall biosynthesis
MTNRALREPRAGAERRHAKLAAASCGPPSGRPARRLSVHTDSEYTKPQRVNSLISVLLPFRDAAATIDAALSGLLAQADGAREVIAIDDGSCDGGAARVRAWARRDARVRLIANDGRGLVSALNLGLAHTRGSLIARMDADDIAHPERLARQRAYLCAHAEVGLLGTRVAAFAEGSEVGEGLTRYVAWQNALLSPDDHARARFIESPLCHPSIMLRRALFDDVGGYRDFDGPEDYELFLRASAGGWSLAKLPEVLLHWRHAPGRATFGDARYALDKFRSTKAPYLSAVVASTHDKRLVMWGAGPTGKRLARALASYGVRFALFIDIDPRKVGSTVQGVPIARSDALDSERDVVIAAVGSRGARALIGPELTTRGFVDGQTAWFAS